MNTKLLAYRAQAYATLGLLIFIITASSWGQCAYADVNAFLLPAQENDLAVLRAAGLHGDRSKLPDMLRALQTEHISYIATALNALEHLGAPEALPALEEFMQKYPAGIYFYQAQAAKARLLAEVEAGKIASITAQNVNRQQRDQVAQTKVQRFLQELHVDARQLSAKVAAYRAAGEQERQGWSLEMNVLNELADMAYRGDSQAYIALPEFKAIDFTVCPAALLKMRYASLPKAQRLNQMVEELAKSKEDDGLLQLAIDEGTAASQAAAAKLKEMDANREKYKVIVQGHIDYPGYAILFRLIAGTGDSTQAPVIERYLHEKAGAIGFFADQTYWQTRGGRRKQWAVGY